MSRRLFTDTACGIKTVNNASVILTSGVYTASRLGKTLGQMLEGSPRETAEAVVSEYRLYGSDIIWTAADLNHSVISALGGKCDFSRPGASATVIRPPVSDIYGIGSLDPADVRKSEAIINQVEIAKHIRELAGDDFAVGVSSWGPFTLAGLLLGTEEFMVTLLTEPDEAKKIIAFAAEAAKEYYEMFFDAGVDCCCIAEPSASCDMISPAMFEEFALPEIAKTAEMLRSAGIISMLHICGDTTKILKSISDTETDIYSFDSKVKLQDALNALDGRVTAAGNLSPAGLILNGTAESVAEAVRECRETAAGRRYIVMPGCDVPPGSPVENIAAMTKEAHL